MAQAAKQGDHRHARPVQQPGRLGRHRPRPRIPRRHGHQPDRQRPNAERPGEAPSPAPTRASSEAAASTQIACHQPTQGAVDGGRTAMENCLSANPNINVVYAINEPAGEGAYAAKARPRFYKTEPGDRGRGADRRAAAAGMLVTSRAASSPPTPAQFPPARWPHSAWTPSPSSPRPAAEASRPGHRRACRTSSTPAPLWSPTDHCLIAACSPAAQPPDPGRVEASAGSSSSRVGQWPDATVWKPNASAADSMRQVIAGGEPPVPSGPTAHD